jgi:hypothetical protein
MHRIMFLSRLVLPALALAALLGHLKFGTGTNGFSTGI